MIDADSISVVLDVLGPEREALIETPGEDAIRGKGPDGEWTLGSVVLGPDQQAADILTCAHAIDDVRPLLRGPAEGVDLVGQFAARP